MNKIIRDARITNGRLCYELKDGSSGYVPVEDAVLAYRENTLRGLALATLCDIVLGEDAEDRSDDALIRRVRELVELDKAVRRRGACGE